MRWFGQAPASIHDRSLDQFFNRKYRHLLDMDHDFQPALNARETEKAYTIEVAMPGLDKQDVDVYVHNGMLTVMCDTRESAKHDDDGYVRREFNYTTAQRTFTLPADVREKEISADYNKGILRISLPRDTQNNPATRVSRIAIS